MRRTIKLLSIGAILFSTLFIMSCDSSDENINTSLNIEEAKLKDFRLTFIKRTGMELEHPEIVDNEEVAYGNIKITVPSTTSLDEVHISITSEELNLSKFSMSPNNIALSFEGNKTHVFTISEVGGDKEALLHYNVSVIKEQPPVLETLKLTSFTFEESKNKGVIPNDITISRRADVNPSYEKVYLIVPVGTDFTKLVPTITYEGSNLYYSQDSSLSSGDMNEKYPDGNPSFDFKYPKPFFLAIKDKDNEKVQLIKVIVDVVNPVKIEMPSVTTPDATEGSPGYFTGVTKWINVGNQIINFQKATTYEDISPVTTPPTNVITVDRELPSGGLLPGESASINVRVFQYFPEETYKTTAVFYTRMYNDNDSDDLFEPSKVAVTTKIVK
ncbi:hypothetical protein [Flavivirga eckloniae]|uniref:Uncharacterized protein n=1 Tax=Flavivirga eckloniae TaxID=1803846 RepID=A0A2K9PL43_9FLAO|nr:hypothetical protein [Flavivirga eckloniae]AUP77746.1 hypothetical protein C1H87_03050 [Flavivirga eckloniae]